MKKLIIFFTILFFSTLIFARPKKVNQIKEKDINILNNLALDCINQKDYELADLYLQKSLLVENNYTANIYMAKIKRSSNDSVNYLLSAYEINPTLEVIWYLVAYYSNLKRDRELAFPYYNLIIESDTDPQHLWTVYGELGVYYSIKCNFEYADKYFEKARKLYEDNSNLSVSSYSFELFDNNTSLNDYINTNKNRKKLYIDYNCKSASDLDTVRESISREMFEYSRKSDSKRLINLLLGNYALEEVEPLSIGDKIKINRYFPFIVVDRQKSNNLYYYLFDYSHITKCYLVISDKQLELEKVLSEGYTPKESYVLEYIGNSTYESNFQDVECFMFKYCNENTSIVPDNLRELYKIARSAQFY